MKNLPQQKTLFEKILDAALLISIGAAALVFLNYFIIDKRFQEFENRIPKDSLTEVIETVKVAKKNVTRHDQISCARECSKEKAIEMFGKASDNQESFFFFACLDKICTEQKTYYQELPLAEAVQLIIDTEKYKYVPGEQTVSTIPNKLVK
jgi:hypothetical protein